MDAAWVPFGIMFQEFHDFRPKDIDCDSHQKYYRVDTWVLGIWTVSIFLISAAYTSNLKSHLIVDDYEKKIETLQQLLDK